MRWGKGSETPSFLMVRPRERGSLRPFSPLQEGFSDPFSHRKRENPAHPQIPLAKIPLAQRVKKERREEPETGLRQNHCDMNDFATGSSHPHSSERGPNTVLESTVSNTKLSEFFGPRRVPGRELSEFLSAYHLCAQANSPSFPQNSPSLP